MVRKPCGAKAPPLLSLAAAGVQRRAAYAAFDGIPLRGRTGDQVYVLGLPERRSS